MAWAMIKIDPDDGAGGLHSLLVASSRTTGARVEFAVTEQSGQVGACWASDANVAA